ncbi:hypothetical protein T439DRAFT_325699 [Meredithblackwellia eburnea MCA 4105]
MSNYSLYSVPAAWMLCIFPHWYAISLTASSKDLPNFKNSCPREFIAKCRALEKQSPVVARYLRAEAASQNGFENIGLWAAAVAIGNAAGIPSSTLNIISGTYLVSRALYNVLYISTTTEQKSALRTLVFGSGVLCIWFNFIKAGLILNKQLL